MRFILRRVGFNCQVTCWCGRYSLEAGHDAMHYSSSRGRPHLAFSRGPSHAEMSFHEASDFILTVSMPLEISSYD